MVISEKGWQIHGPEPLVTGLALGFWILLILQIRHYNVLIDITVDYSSIECWTVEIIKELLKAVMTGYYIQQIILPVCTGSVATGYKKSLKTGDHSWPAVLTGTVIQGFSKVVHTGF
jgi:hypothetical protein